MLPTTNNDEDHIHSLCHKRSNALFLTHIIPSLFLRDVYREERHEVIHIHLYHIWAFTIHMLLVRIHLY
jgi:hypothetical protein